jgi:GH24 family phage-related lysozyme (muramidase)
VRDGVWVVGFGHVRVGDAGAAVTREEAGEMLMLDLAPFERCVNEAVTPELTQSQYDALVSFVFSIGVEAFLQSAVLRRVNNREFVAAACAMDAWRMSDPHGEMEIIDMLVRRRTAEKSLFLAGSKIKMAPTVLVRGKLDHAASILGAPLVCASAPQIGALSASAEAEETSPRATEQSKANPGGDALLLTQVATAEQLGEQPSVQAGEQNNEAAEAPAAVAVSSMPWRKLQHSAGAWMQKLSGVKWAPSERTKRALESVGLLALFTFGAALAGLGGAMLLGGRSDAVDVFGAAALTAPGLAAMGIAVIGLWGGPSPSRA